MTTNKIFVLPFVDDHFIESLVFDVGSKDDVATLLDRVNNHAVILAANVQFEKIAVIGSTIATLERNASLLTYTYGQRFIALKLTQQLPTIAQIPPEHNLDALTQEKLNEVSRRLSEIEASRSLKQLK